MHQTENLKASLAQFAVDNAADGIVWMLSDGSHFYVNNAFCRLLGYTREELLALKLFAINPRMTPEYWAEHWAELKRQGALRQQTVLRGKDGREVAVEISANFLTQDGKDYTCASIRDVTERARVDEALRHNDMLLRIAGQSARLGGWAVDLVSGQEMWSDEVCAIHELPKGSSRSVDKVISLYAPEWRQRIKTVFEACARDGTPYDEEMEILTARGRRVWVRTIGEAVRDAQGRITQVQGAIQDVTHKKLGELTLRRSERRFRELADAMPLIVWTADPDGVLDYANRALFDYAGISSADLPSGDWIQILHPDDRDPCLAAWNHAIENGSDYTLEFRIRDQHKGHYRWHLVRAAPVRGATAVIEKWYGTCTDIHDQKLSENELCRLASRFQNTLESITDAFYTVDRQWRFTYLNSEAERLLQRSRGDLIGKVLWDEFPKVRNSRIGQAFEGAVAQGVTVQLEEQSVSLGMWVELRGYPSEEGLAVYFRDITERKEAEQNIHFLASYDPLTRLPNRRLVHDRLQQELAASNRSRQIGAVLFLDLDNFKTLNDTLGHDEGDSLLQQVAARLTSCLRGEDTVGRFGGDEFVLILGKLGTCPEQAGIRAEALGEKILSLLSQPYQLGEHQRRITTSIGITLFGKEQDSVNESLKRADFAMYQAKAGGRNTLRLFDPVMQDNVSARLALEADMRSGLERQEFLPYYQPQVDGAGRLTGAEALARWQHPQRGLVPPGEFIPLAEDTGLILPLGRIMLVAVCNQLASWARRPETAGLHLAVNISARHFHHPDFVTRVLDVIEQTGANPARLKLELTESLLLEDVEDTITKMTALKVRGVCFSLDDFGTGYSSLYYLKRLPLDQLKIDQRFVRDVITDPNDAVIVRTILILAQSLGLDVIAEGVETKAMRDFLAQHGCSAYQGFFYSHPLPIQAFETYMQDQAQPRLPGQEPGVPSLAPGER